MQFRPDERYTTVRQLAEDVERWLSDEPVTAYRDTASERFGRWLRRHRSTMRVSAAALVSVAAIAVAAALLINEYRLKEARRAELLNLLGRFDVTLAKEKQSLSEDDYLDLEATTRQIAEYSPERAQTRRRELQEDYANQLKTLLAAPRFDDQLRTQFDRGLEFLRERSVDKSTLEQLQAERDQRLRQWDEIFVLAAPFPRGGSAVFEAADVAEVDERLTRVSAAESDDHRPVVSRVVCPAGKLEFQATFDRTWTHSSVLGLVLHHDDEGGYRFLIFVPQLNPRRLSPRSLRGLPTAGKVISSGLERELKMAIVRDGTVLRERPVRLGAGRLRVLAQRDGSRLTMTVNDSQTITCLDPFPLSARREGSFAMFWPAHVGLESCLARRQRSAAKGSPLERGDDLYSRGEFGDALTSFREVEALPDVLPNTLSEAQFKMAMCHLEMGSRDEYLKLLEKLRSQMATADEQARSQWLLLAAFRLVQEQVLAADWDRVLELAAEIEVYFNLEQIAELLPARGRAMVLEQLRRDGQRFRLALERENTTAMLQRAVRLGDLFNEDALSRRQTRWRQADAYRMNGQLDKALEVLQSLVADPDPTIGASERIAIIADLAWVLGHAGRDDEALALVDRWLTFPEDGYEPVWLPLLLERARIEFRRGDRAAAEQSLQDFFRLVPVNSIPYSTFAEACLLRGWLLKQAGQEGEARSQWLDGARRFWRGDRIDPRRLEKLRGAEMVDVALSLWADGTVASLTGELDLEDAEQMLENHIGGSGLASETMRKLASNALPAEFLQQLALSLYRSQRGEQHVARALKRQLTLREFHIEPLYLMIYQAVLISAFPEEDVPDEVHDLVHQQCAVLVESFDQRRIDTTVMQQIVEIWRGKFTGKEWSALSKSLDPQMAASVAFVFGRVYLYRFEEQRPKIARVLFEYAVQNEAALPLVVELSQAELAKLDKPGNGDQRD